MGYVLKCNRYRLVDNRSFELPLPMKYVLLKEDSPVAEYDISTDERVSCRILTKYKEEMLTPINRPLSISDIYFFLSSRVFQENTPFAANALSLVGLEKYNVLEIAKITRGITPYDEYWLKFEGDTFNYEQALDNFNKIFSPSAPAFEPAAPISGVHHNDAARNDSADEAKAAEILNQHKPDVSAIQKEVAESAAKESVSEDEPLKNNTMSADEIEALLVKSGLSADIPNFDDDDDDDDDELSGGAMSQEDIEKLLASAQGAPVEEKAEESAPETTSGGKMSQDDIEKLLASAQGAPVEEKAEESAPESTSGGKMSQEDIERLLASAQGAPVEEKAEETAPESTSGGKMSQEDIEKLLASAQGTPVEEKAEESAPEATSGGKMSQDDIEKLLASAQGAPVEEKAEESAPESASGGKMSQDDIEKLLASAQGAPVEEKAEENAPETTSGGKMSQDDIEKLLASAQGAPVEEKAEESAPESTSGGKMSQEDIEALLSGMKEDASK